MGSRRVKLTKCEAGGKSGRRAAGWCLVLLLAACSRSPVDELPAPDHRTTSGAVVLHNLNGQIERWQAAGWEALREEQRTGLIDALLLRFRLRLMVADLQAAETLSGQWVQAHGDTPAAAISRIRVLQLQHRSRDVQPLLQGLAGLPLTPEDANTLDRLRCADALARGDYAMAWACAESAARETPDFRTLSALALVLSALDRPALAAQTLDCAWSHLSGPSPLPLAWWYAQQAGHWDAQARGDAARAAFDRAASLLPEHLGVSRERALLLHAQGDVADAVASMRAVARASGDSDAWAWLAQWTGRAADRAAAETRFAADLAAFPAAFRVHAAEFALGIGQLDQAQALAAAAVADAATISHLQLLLDVVRQRGDAAAAQQLAAQIEATQRAVGPLAAPDCSNRP